MAWAFWLAVPVAGTVLVAIWSWWRARPVRAVSADTIAAHAAYLAALAPPAASTDVLAAEPVLPDPRRSP